VFSPVYDFGPLKYSAMPLSIIDRSKLKKLVYFAPIGFGTTPIIFFAIVAVLGPETLIKARPELPAAVARAAIVSACLLIFLFKIMY
jgi:hypothetical protein